MIRVFKHYISKSLVVLGTVEASLFIASVYLGTALRFNGNPTFDDPEHVQSVGLIAVVFMLIMMSCLTAVGLYQRHLRDGLTGMFLRIGVAFLIGFVIMSLIFYLFPAMFLGRGAFGLSYGSAFGSLLVARLVYVKLINRDVLKRRILVVGAGQKAALIEEKLKRRADRHGFVIAGYVAIKGEETHVSPSQVLHADEPLIQLAQVHDVDELVVAISDRRNAFPVDEILDCKMSGIEVVDVLTFFERQTGRVLLDIIHPSWFIFSDGFSDGVLRNFWKRLFDIVASLLLLSVALPFMILAAICVVLEDRGPIFYRQIRVGQNWKLVQVLKFRSMRTDAEKAGAQFAQKNDSRVTNVGKIMRKTRIDELPQLINVLKGDMSFVGPRPERPEFVEKFSQSIPYYSERHRVKPGITGWAQICYPYGSSERDTIEKLQYDLYYVKNYTLFLDLMVLLNTAEVILWGKGAR